MVITHETTDEFRYGRQIGKIAFGQRREVCVTDLGDQARGGWTKRESPYITDEG